MLITVVGRFFRFLQEIDINNANKQAEQQLMIKDTFKENSIELLRIKNRQKDIKYSLTREGFNFLMAIEGPVAVISICGMIQTGKSFLLNSGILNQENGFQVSQSSQGTSQGFQCWGTPIKIKNSQGQYINIIVIDSQGLKSNFTQMQNDLSFLNLLLLLSSCFIYNQMEYKNENSLKGFNPSSKIMKVIDDKLNQFQKSEDFQDQIFPEFYWVIRDAQKWTNQDILKQYFKQSLNINRKIQKNKKNQNKQIDKVVMQKSNFFPIPKYCEDEFKGKKSSTESNNKLKKIAFSSQIKNLRSHIFENIKVKTFKGKKLNGNLLCAMILSYINDINKGFRPNILNVCTKMSHPICRQAIDEAFEIFKNSTRIETAKQQKTFQLEIQSARRYTIIKYLCKRKISNSQVDSGFIFLQQFITAHIENLKTKNGQKSQELLQSYIRKNSEDIRKRLKMNQFLDYSQYRRQIYGLREEFFNVGPKYPNYSLFYNSSFTKLQCMGIIYFQYRTSNLRLTLDIIDEIQRQFATKSIINPYKQLCWEIIKSKNERDPQYIHEYRFFCLTRQCEIMAQLHFQERQKKLVQLQQQNLDVRKQYQSFLEEIELLGRESEQKKINQSNFQILSRKNFNQMNQILAQNALLLKENVQKIGKYRQLIQKCKSLFYNLLEKTKIIKKQKNELKQEE